MSKQQLQNVSFEIIRYANCWEDSCILLEALADSEGHRIMSIASAGDNSFSLLTLNPELVVAIDISEIQLHLVELKKLAISKLDREAFLAFAGFDHANNRIAIYDLLKADLSTAARDYWNVNQTAIENGIINNGKFEQFFLYFKENVLPQIHSQEKVKELLTPKTATEQQQFFNEVWNNEQWQVMFPQVFNKHIFGKYGRDPEFMKYVEISVPDYIREAAKKHYESTNCFENPFLWFFLTGSFGEFLPHYVREGNYELIQQNIDRLELYNGLIENGLKKYSGISRWNLSNIFEYMDVPLFKTVASQLVEGSTNEAIFAYWNLMIDRRIGEHFDAVHFQSELSDQLTEKDHGYFYKKFVVDHLKK